MRRWIIPVLLGLLGIGAVAHWTATEAPPRADRSGSPRTSAGKAEAPQGRRAVEERPARTHDPGLPVTLTDREGNVSIVECEELTLEQIIERGARVYNRPRMGTGTRVRWDALGCLDAGCGANEEGGRAWGTRILHFVRRQGTSSIGGRCETPVTMDFTRVSTFSARFFVDRSVLESTGVFSIGVNADVFHPRYETNLAVINLRSMDVDDADRDGDTSEVGPAELRVGAPRRSKTLPLEPFIDHWTEVRVVVEKRERPGPSQHLCTYEIRREEAEGKFEHLRFRDIPCDLPPETPWQLESESRTESRIVSGQGGGKLVVNSRAGATVHMRRDGTSFPYANLPADSAGRDDGFILVDRISWTEMP